jgi:HK97 family phage prohead protease
MQTKDFRVSVKAAGEADGLADGQFEAIVSVFGNEDSVGDVVMPGAFQKTLADWEAKGDPIPVIWSHDWRDPFSHLGTVEKAEERPEGLWVRAQIQDLDTNPKAAQIYRLLKGRRVTQMSFAYDVVDAGWGKREGDREVYELRELKVHEVGPCLIGANQETELLAVKAQQMADGAKAGRVLSGKNYARLVEARDALTSVLDAAAPTEDAPKNSGADVPVETDEPSQAVEPATQDDEPDGAKSSEPSRSVPRRARAVAIQMQMS